jgi:hypothetical protein
MSQHIGNGPNGTGSGDSGHHVTDRPRRLRSGDMRTLDLGKDVLGAGTPAVR